jgi:hypothetical protein
MILKNDKTIIAYHFGQYMDLKFFFFFIGLRPKLGNTYYHIIN